MNHRDARTAEMSVGTRMLTGPISIGGFAHTSIDRLLCRITKQLVQAPFVCLIIFEAHDLNPNYWRRNRGSVSGRYLIQSHP